MNVNVELHTCYPFNVGRNGHKDTILFIDKVFTGVASQFTKVGPARGMRSPIDLRPGTGKTFLCLHPSINFLYIVLATQKL